MHILINVLHRPSEPTGVCRHGVNLARCLATDKRVQKITLVIGNWQQAYFTEAFDLPSPKIQILTVEIKNTSLSRNLWFIFGLPKLANKINPDLVHMAFPVPFLRSLFTIPVVSTIHDLYPYECPENFGYPNVLFNRWFLKQSVNQSDGLTCVSQLTLDKLKQYFPRVKKKKKLSVVYNYVNFNNIESQISEALSSINNNPFILSVAQHRKNKNLDLLIQAFFALLQQNKLQKSVKLLIVGSSGPETENLKVQIAKLALQKQVLLISAIDDSQLCWLYQNCQLFVIPSSTEGFCLPLAEALYFSRPVVCSDIPIFREIGQNNCTYFELEENPVQNCVRAIARSLESSKQHQKSASFLFSIDNARKQYLNFSRSVL